MSEFKGTPGPWEWNGKWRVCAGVNTPHISVVCDTATRNSDRNERNNANACLIAAAPDLLAACEDALTTYEADMQHILDNGRLCNALRAVIAKAKGTDR